MKLYQRNSGRRSIARLARQMAVDASLGGAVGALLGLMLGGFKPTGAGTSLEHFVFAVSVSACCGISTALLGLFDGTSYCDDVDEPVSPAVCGKVQSPATAPAAVAAVESFPRMMKPAPAEILRTSA